MLSCMNGKLLKNNSPVNFFPYFFKFWLWIQPENEDKKKLHETFIWKLCIKYTKGPSKTDKKFIFWKHEFHFSLSNSPTEKTKKEIRSDKEQNTIKKKSIIIISIYSHEQSSSCILYMGKSSRFNNLSPHNPLPPRLRRRFFRYARIAKYVI